MTATTDETDDRPDGSSDGSGTAQVTTVHRVTVPIPVEDLAHYRRARGGRGLEAARAMSPTEIVDRITAAGLRGRGGAGYPTGRKWATVLAYHSERIPTTVVVNAAEGEPGTIKDRHLLRTNPFPIVEGALIAARAVRASEVVFALKQKETAAVASLRRAVEEVTGAGWADGVVVRVVEGPDAYLFGEETALLEVVEGRLPFPRIAPPWRRGVHELGMAGTDREHESNLSADVEMAGATDAPPALVNNAETMANVPRILARGPRWFRSEGTTATPGTFVCTIAGDTLSSGVAEVIAGTTLREAIDLIGGGMERGRSVKAVLAGVSNRVITPDLLDTPITYEDMQPLGIGPGSAGFIVFDDTTDMVSVAAGVARFLSIESCGQCTPCKLDGLTIARVLAGISANDARQADLTTARRRLGTVANGARCFLASQQQTAVGSILEAFPEEFQSHLRGSTSACEPALVAELMNVTTGYPEWDERHASKNPDWSFDQVWNGQNPVDRYRNHVLEETDV